MALGDREQNDYSAYHVLAIGRPTRSPLLQQVNPLLPQPFTPGADGLQQQVDDVVFRLPPGLDLGLLESIPSPWSAERVFLAVTGTSDAGMQQASEFMTDSERAWELKGSLAMLRDGRLILADDRELTTAGRLTAVAGAAPEARVVGTATPAALQTPTPAADEQPAAQGQPAGQDRQATNSANLSYPERYPFLLPLVIGLGGLGILGIGATMYRQKRREQ
jgi:hypothetical protein